MQQAIDVASGAFVRETTVLCCLIANFHVHVEIAADTLLVNPLVRVLLVGIIVTLMEHFWNHGHLQGQALRVLVCHGRRMRERNEALILVT